jgi:hypothetical protein
MAIVGYPESAVTIWSTGFTPAVFAQKSPFRVVPPDEKDCVAALPASTILTYIHRPWIISVPIGIEITVHIKSPVTWAIVVEGFLECGSGFVHGVKVDNTISKHVLFVTGCSIRGRVGKVKFILRALIFPITNSG